MNVYLFNFKEFMTERKFLFSHVYY